MGAAVSIAPIIPELAERVLLTLLSLEASLEILRKHYGWRRRKKMFFKMVFGGKEVFRKNLGMGLPCPGDFKGKFLKRGFCWKQWLEENVLRKTWCLSNYVDRKTVRPHYPWMGRGLVGSSSKLVRGAITLEGCNWMTPDAGLRSKGRQLTVADL